MRLEDIAKTYGMNDYYDNIGGRMIGTTRMEGNYCG